MCNRTEREDAFRMKALELAVTAEAADHYVGPYGFPSILNHAREFLSWLRNPMPAAILLVRTSDPVSETTQQAQPWKDTDMTQINTGQKFSVEATPRDAAGFEVEVDATFTIADPSIATVEPYLDEAGVEDPDKKWIVSQAPGSTVLTVTIASGDGGDLTVTHAVDVVPAGVAALDVVAGEPEAE